MSAAPAFDLVDARLERTLVAALIARPDLYLALPEAFGGDMFGDYHSLAIFQAIANIVADHDIVTRDAVRERIARKVGHLDLEWFDDIAALEVAPAAPVLGWVDTLTRLHKRRTSAVDDAEPNPKRPPWRTAPELVEAIMERAADPWVDLTIGGESLCRVRAGGTVVLIGGSGSGKSSLVAGVLIEHAVNVGPAIALSIELPADELGARIVGMKCDASWEDALRGNVDRRFMEQALALPRLYVLDRRRATLANLEKCVAAARVDHPGEPILVAIDYAQLLDSKEREARMRVADAFAQIDDVAREHRFVAVALSQMSRASAQKARRGESIGAESADLGAETAAIERFATVTLSIGMAADREDGSSAVELSVGKARMGKGDRVIPMTYEGRIGRWRVAGEAKTATEVRDARDVEKEAKARSTIEMAMLALARSSASPVARQHLVESISGRKATKNAAVAALLARGDLIEVDRKQFRSRYWLVWTPDQAHQAGIAGRQDVQAGGPG